MAEADDAEAVLAQVSETAPDVVWLGLRLPGRPAPCAGRRRSARWCRRPGGVVVADDREAVGDLRPCAAGARGPAPRPGVSRARRGRRDCSATAAPRPGAAACIEPATWPAARPTYAGRPAGPGPAQQVAPPTAQTTASEQVLEALADGRVVGRASPRPARARAATAVNQTLRAGRRAAAPRHTRAEAVAHTAVRRTRRSGPTGADRPHRATGRLVGLMGVFDKLLRAGEGKQGPGPAGAGPRDQRARARDARRSPTTRCRPRPASSASGSTTARPRRPADRGLRRHPRGRPPGASASATTTCSSWAAPPCTSAGSPR